MKCQIYPSMQLGGTPPQLYDQVKDGVVDVIWTLPGYTAGRFPLVEVFELPFMMREPEGTSKALWEYVAAVRAERVRRREAHRHARPRPRRVPHDRTSRSSRWPTSRA